MTILQWLEAGCRPLASCIAIGRTSGGRYSPCGHHGKFVAAPKDEGLDACYFHSDLVSSRCGTTLPAASRNQARKMYQEECSVSPGIGSEIGSAASTPSNARQPAITKSAIFGA